MTGDSPNGVYVNLMSDFGFKRIFGDSSCKPLLINFLNALFHGDIVVDDVVYDNVERQPLLPEKRGLRYDIYCHSPHDSNPDKASRHFIIEMQNENQKHFEERAIYYTSYSIYRQGEKGGDYDFALVPVIGIFVMAFDWERERRNDRMVERKGYVDLDTHELFCDKVRMYFVKLPLTKQSAEECKSDIEKWTYCIKNLENMNSVPFANTDPVFAQLEERARMANLTDRERLEYESSLKAMRDQQNIANYNYEIGLFEGQKRGEKRGEKRGIIEGIKMMVKKMKENGISIDQICKMSGLSIEEVSAL